MAEGGAGLIQVDTPKLACADEVRAPRTPTCCGGSDTLHHTQGSRGGDSLELPPPSSSAFYWPNPGGTCKWCVGAWHGTAPMHQPVPSQLWTGMAIIPHWLAMLFFDEQTKGWRDLSKLPDDTLDNGRLEFRP